MILVSILGDFHSSIVPISYEFKDKITKHILVHDDAKGDVKEATRIRKGQEAFLEQHSDISYELINLPVDEDSFTSLLGCVERIKQEANEYSDIYLNATDGLSSIVLVLSSHLMAIGAKVLAYDRYANTYNLHTTQGMQKIAIQNSMDIKTHLMMKGYKIVEYIPKAELERRKEHIMALSSNLSRYKKFADAVAKSGYDNVKGFDDFKSHFEAIGIKKQKFIQGTVFEEYIYHLIKDNFEFDDVCTGVKVSFDEDVSNEFDILMIKDNHLHTIECKLVSSLDGGHFVYKTELVKDYLDDDGKAMILSIGADNIKFSKSGKKKTQFTIGDHARARYGEIAIHQSKEFNKEAFFKDVRECFLSY